MNYLNHYGYWTKWLTIVEYQLTQWHHFQVGRNLPSTGPRSVIFFTHDITHVTPSTLLIIEVKFCEGSWIIWRVGSTAHHTHLLDSKENSRRRRRPPLLLLLSGAAAAATSSMFFCFALHCFFWDQAGQAESQNLRMRCVFLQTRFPLCAILAIDLKKGPL